jgi:Uncharacterised nucleotidyltransferase
MRRRLRPEEELMLLMAGTHDRRATARIGELDWAAMLAHLEYQGLAPLLGKRILEAAGSAAPRAFARAVSEATRASHDAGALLELTTLRIATALEAARVANVPLKGPLLARELHGDAGMRSSRDVDVLVAADDLGRAADALASLGWRPKAGQATDPLLHLALVHDAGLPDIELHWRVHWYESEFGAKALARAQVGADGVRRLRGPDDLAALMLFQARDGFAGLRHPADVAAWWDAHATDRGPPLLTPIVAHHPSLRRALTASAALLERLVGVPARRLVDMPDQLPRASRCAIALANPLMRGSPEQIMAEVSLVDGLLSPRGERIAFVRRRVLPSAVELPGSSGERHLGLARAEHTLRVAGRYAVAVLRSRPSAG